MRKSLFALLFSIALFMGLDRLVHTTSTRFSLSKITTTYHAPEWEIPPVSEAAQKEIDAILSQKFTYFSKGAQTYVFISEDKQHVIKFLKQNKIYPQTWLAYLPLPFNPYCQEKLFLEKQRDRTFNAGKIAFTQFKQETGMVYAHLNRTNNLKKQVVLIDKKGKLHGVSLDDVSFFIQKKADLIYPRIKELMSKNDTEGAKKILRSVFSLIETLGRKGIVENDPVIRKNFGLVNDKAIQLDIGYMRVDPTQPLKYKSEIRRMTSGMSRWIGSNYPELSSAFEAYLAAVST